MVKKKTRPALVDIEVGPFSDVSFLLIIFFILTTQIAAFKGTVISIPSGSQQQEQTEKKNEKKQLIVHLEGDNVHVGQEDGQSIRLDSPVMEKLKYEVLKEVASKKEKNEPPFIILQASGDVPYNTYFNVVTMISRCGGLICLLEDDTPSKKSGAEDSKGE